MSFTENASLKMIVQSSVVEEKYFCFRIL